MTKPSKEKATTKVKKSQKPSQLKQTQKNTAASESAKAAPTTFAVTPKELVNIETQTDRDLNESIRRGLESVNDGLRRVNENSGGKLLRKENPEGKSLSSLGQIKSLKAENDALKKELKVIREKYKARGMKIQEALRHLRCVNSIKHTVRGLCTKFPEIFTTQATFHMFIHNELVAYMLYCCLAFRFVHSTDAFTFSFVSFSKSHRSLYQYRNLEVRTKQRYANTICILLWAIKRNV
ncbi:hypothetical protein GQX74_001482 [Glossina fuscipes]|nr:hypothetical protein GQX74_001482 [Glossina fuscipes]